MSLTSTEIVRFRLINQQLINTTFKTGKEMVSWFGAVQGQEYAQTKWSLGLRLPHLKDADIEGISRTNKTVLYKQGSCNSKRFCYLVRLDFN